MGHVVASSPTRNWVYFWDCEEAPEVPDNVVVPAEEEETAEIESVEEDGDATTNNDVEPVNRFYITHLLLQQHILSSAAIIAQQYRDNRQEQEAALRLYNYRLAQTLEAFLAHGF